MTEIPSSISTSAHANDSKNGEKKPNLYFVIPDELRKKINKHRMILVMDLD